MAFELPRYRKCCCLSLRTGSLIIGYVSIIIALLALSSISWFIYRVATFVDTHMDKPQSAHSPGAMRQTAVDLYISLAYSLLVYLYYFIFSFILVIGAHRNKPSYLRLYYRATRILFGMGVAMVIITTIFIGILPAIGVLKWVFTLLFCLVIVRSAYLEMEETQKRPVDEIPPEVELQPVQPYSSQLAQQQQTPLMA